MSQHFDDDFQYYEEAYGQQYFKDASQMMTNKNENHEC